MFARFGQKISPAELNNLTIQPNKTWFARIYLSKIFNYSSNTTFK